MRRGSIAGSCIASWMLLAMKSCGGVRWWLPRRTSRLVGLQIRCEVRRRNEAVQVEIVGEMLDQGRRGIPLVVPSRLRHVRKRSTRHDRQQDLGLGRIVVLRVRVHVKKGPAYAYQQRTRARSQTDQPVLLMSSEKDPNATSPARNGFASEARAARASSPLNKYHQFLGQAAEHCL